MGTPIVLPQHVVDQMRERYAQGGISMAKLAAGYDVSETTAFRVINQLGAYVKASVVQTKEEVSLAAQESLKRFLELQREEEAKLAVPKPKNPYY